LILTACSEGLGLIKINEEEHMDSQVEVLSPWADVDPMPSRGISPRVTEFKGKNIGLFTNNKRAAPLIMNVVEKELKKIMPDTNYIWYEPVQKSRYSDLQMENPVNRMGFQKWVREVDAVVLAVGD
jgi:hypothetical protein